MDELSRESLRLEKNLSVDVGEIAKQSKNYCVCFSIPYSHYFVLLVNFHILILEIDIMSFITCLDQW